MKQNDEIAYEKPELLKYSLFGVANGDVTSNGGPSYGGDSDDDDSMNHCEEGFFAE